MVKVVQKSDKRWRKGRKKTRFVTFFTLGLPDSRVERDRARRVAKRAEIGVKKSVFPSLSDQKWPLILL